MAIGWLAPTWWGAAFDGGVRRQAQSRCARAVSADSLPRGNSMEHYPMTPEGFESINEELKRLSGTERHELSKQIETAREHGDLKENAEYHAAKEKQGMMEARIGHLEGMISRAEVIGLEHMTGDRVRFGARVFLEDLDSGDTKSYRIVGGEEADVKAGTISVTSPVARALINREIGDEVHVKTPGGVKNYEISDIEWP